MKCFFGWKFFVEYLKNFLLLVSNKKWYGYFENGYVYVIINEMEVVCFVMF